MMNWHMIIPGLIVVVIKAVGTTLFLLYFSQLFERNNESFVPTGSYGTRISFFAQSAVQKDDYAPYLVYLKSHFNPCVGVLIKPSWVLAPSHCYLPNMKVMLGNFKSRIRDGTEQTINPIQIIRYWKYNDTAPQDDLMLIRLAKPATFNPKVQVLPIATSDVRPGTICVLSGLDWSQENNGRHPDLRQNLEAPVMTDKDCQNTEQGRSHRNSLCVKFVKVFNRIFGEVAVATVICKDKLQGIEVGNFMGGDVGIYTNVYKYVSWIEENTKDRKK